MTPPGSPLHYVLLGTRIGPYVSFLCYLLPFAFLASKFSDWFIFNGCCQVALFVPVVIVPAFLTGHMAYVDIGWPWGLVVLAVNVLNADGYRVRRLVVGSCMLLHGLRMGLGGLVQFFPYRWREDLPRYRYARVRWIEHDGMPPAHWRFRMLHDLLGQAHSKSG